MEKCRVYNYAGNVRRVSDRGKTYLVAPLTLIVPGVLAGSQGPLFYPAEEIASNPSAWDGVPITIGHPIQNGRPVSARSPGVKSIGRVRHARTGPGGKLVAEGWFDIQAARRADPQLLADLEAGRKVELSTGLFTENHPAPFGSHHRGRPYDYVARNYRPDHLAILPGEVGACSLGDGCGVNVNRRTTVMSRRPVTVNQIADYVSRQVAATKRKRRKPRPCSCECDMLIPTSNYDADQPRAGDGKWTSGGGSSGGGKATSPSIGGKVKATLDRIAQVVKKLPRPSEQTIKAAGDYLKRGLTFIRERYGDKASLVTFAVASSVAFGPGMVGAAGAAAFGWGAMEAKKGISLLVSLGGDKREREDAYDYATAGFRKSRRPGAALLGNAEQEVDLDGLTLEAVEFIRGFSKATGTAIPPVTVEQVRGMLEAMVQDSDRVENFGGVYSPQGQRSALAYLGDEDYARIERDKQRLAAVGLAPEAKALLEPDDEEEGPGERAAWIAQENRRRLGLSLNANEAADYLPLPPTLAEVLAEEARDQRARRQQGPSRRPSPLPAPTVNADEDDLLPLPRLMG